MVPWLAFVNDSSPDLLLHIVFEFSIHSTSRVFHAIHLSTRLCYLLDTGHLTSLHFIVNPPSELISNNRPSWFQIRVSHRDSHPRPRSPEWGYYPPSMWVIYMFYDSIIRLEEKWTILQKWSKGAEYWILNDQSSITRLSLILKTSLNVISYGYKVFRLINSGFLEPYLFIIQRMKLFRIQLKLSMSLSTSFYLFCFIGFYQSR